MTRATPLPPELRGRAFRVDEARAAGVSSGRLRANDLSIPHRGVRVAAGRGAPSLLERCRAYALHAPDDVIFCGPTAAALWQIPLPSRLEQHRQLHVLQTRTDSAPRGPGIAGHKTALPIEVVERDGLRMTDAVATWFALGALMSHDDVVVAGDRLVGLPHRLVDPEALAARVARHAGARGAKRVRAAFDDVRVGSRSPRETTTRLALVRAGLPAPELNARILLPCGRAYHGDLVYRVRRLVLEYEGEQHLTDPVQWARDLRRYNDFAEAGWTVIRLDRLTPVAEVVAQVHRLLST